MATLVNTFLKSFNNKLEPSLRLHLGQVYACFTLTTLVAAAGACVHLYTDAIKAGKLCSSAAVVLFILLIATPKNSGKNVFLRLGLLSGFAFLCGVDLGPLFALALRINPSIVVTALISTILVFVSFSICSLFSERGKWLYLGGILMSYVNSVFVLSLLFGYGFLFQVELYLGLMAACGFVLYDTQAIVERHRMGNADFVIDSLVLFIDFIDILRRLLIILIKKEKGSGSKQEN